MSSPSSQSKPEAARNRATPAPARSMTGFAQARTQTSAGELTISLRGVNHRGLDLQFFYSPELARYENAMRKLLKNSISRGHIEIRTTLQREQADGSGMLNRDVLARYVADFRAVAGKLGLPSEPNLNALLSLPGVIGHESETINFGAAFEEELTAALASCIAELNQTREREAVGLLAQISAEVKSVETQVAVIEERRGEMVASLNRRLRSRLNDLLASATVSEARIAEEAAIMADRSDIQEELTRLQVHVQELKRILLDGGEMGKRLDFLLQELNREANTVLSKAGSTGDLGLELTGAGLAVKAHLEKIREQALNLE